MALDLTPEQKEIGKANFHRAVGGLAEEPATPPAEATPPGGVTRRGFMKGLLAAGAVLPVTAAAYFGYRHLHGGRPVRAGLIGAGDEGGVLIGEHNPEFVEFVAVSDIRPSNMRRIFEGEPQRPGASLWRKGFNRIYGSGARNIRRYENYQELLNNPDVEMVVIALPLHLHARVTIEALRAGKHVLCEKLMARNVRQCKEMIQAATTADRLLSIGHQRHYSLLYAQANELLTSEVLGDIRHIRALWHRNNTIPLTPQERAAYGNDPRALYRDGWRAAIKPEDRAALTEERLQELGYRRTNSHTALEELVRWRLYNRTGGGLMAELGSHQLDACSIFLGKKHPIAVTGVGGKYFYNDDREVEDHVFCSFEFPGKDYRPGARSHDDRGIPQHQDVVVVTYSSVSTNSFENYGECVMGSKGTLVVELEQAAMLWPAAGRTTSVTVTRSSGRPVMDTAATSGPADATPAQTLGQRSLGQRVSRGYREEMEHLAWCIRMRDEGMASDREDLRPRCHGQAAMADAIIALAANQAMRSQTRVVFDERWFDGNSPVVPPWDPRAEEA
ncbi:MAG: Gfo/Idh/MocA family oxidoreductase [Gemmataceae bacterium]|nr:Gfo/Idh/MocA family oxidoreductase [Gemmataceae bacterium]